MKKYKIYFSLFNLLGESQAEVVKLQMIFKTISATAITGTWYASDANNALWVGVGGIIVDTLLACLFFEEKKVKHKEEHEHQPSKPNDNEAKGN